MLGAWDTPVHAGLLATTADDGFAAGFHDTGADEEAGFAVGAVLHAGGIVARLAGIYGQDRWALLQKYMGGTAVIEGDGNRFLNQIHRADAVSALVCLLNADPTDAAGIYNVADGTSVPQREVYAAFSEHFKRPLPPSGPPDLERKRGWTHKHVSNSKLRALGWHPLFPSFREALEGNRD